MKKVLISMVMACVTTSVMAQQKPAIPRDEALEAKEYKPHQLEENLSILDIH